MKRALILVLALAVATPAFAGQPVELKAQTLASGPVTLGDLFDGAGSAAGVVVGPAARPGLNIILDAGQVQRLAHSAGLDWANPTGLRRIIVQGGAAQASVVQTTAAKPGAMTPVLAYARNLNAGDIIQPEDLTWGEAASFAVPQDAPGDPDSVIGKQVRRPLRAGAPVAGRDLASPQVIKRDDMVQVAFQSGGISLSLQGKAMEAASVGQSFSVQNTASKKVIEAVATGPGQAVVGPAADRLKAAALPVRNPLAFR